VFPSTKNEEEAYVFSRMKRDHRQTQLPLPRWNRSLQQSPDFSQFFFPPSRVIGFLRFFFFFSFSPSVRCRRARRLYRYSTVALNEQSLGRVFWFLVCDDRGSLHATSAPVSLQYPPRFVAHAHDRLLKSAMSERLEIGTPLACCKTDATEGSISLLSNVEKKRMKWTFCATGFSERSSVLET
jgi:hypothetical protein